MFILVVFFAWIEMGDLVLGLFSSELQGASIWILDDDMEAVLGQLYLGLELVFCLWIGERLGEGVNRE